MRIFAMSAALTVCLAGAAAADTPLPHEKVGLWQQDMVMMGHPVSSQFCIDEAAEAKMSVFSASLSRSGRCDRSPVVHEADGTWSSTSSCHFGPGPARTNRAVVSGDFNSKFTETLVSVPDGKTVMTITSTWTGPCKPGMRGGDVIMSNGTKMNMLDMSAPDPAH